MAEPLLVADCVKAMRDAVGIPVTVKHRIGVDRVENYAFVRDFVGTLALAGCEVFLVHARSAWLQGLSPKENRELPPLRYETVHRLKRDFPELTIVLNGGVKSADEMASQLQFVDGVMIGREAYHHPWGLADWDRRFFGDSVPGPNRAEVELRMVEYCESLQARGERWPSAARHMLGLWNGTPGARKWRQVWSDHRLKLEPPRRVWQLAQRPALHAEVA